MEVQTETTANITTAQFVQPQVERSIHPSKTKENNFYWKVSIRFAADEKPVEKFSKLFEGEEACQADMDANSEAKVQEVIAKRK